MTSKYYSEMWTEEEIILFFRFYYPRSGSSAGYKAGKPQVFMPMQQPYNQLYTKIAYF